MVSDAQGLHVTAAGPEAAAALDATVAAYCGLRSDTGDCLKRALGADPDLVMAHILKGCFMMLFGRRDFVAKAQRAAEAAEAAVARVGAEPRERAHLDALRHWARGDWRGAVSRWEAILIDHPRDLVALKLAQYGTFYRGDSEGMRDSVARILYAWDEGVPGYGFVLGSYAFGLEEAGDYAAAERVGRRAIELNPADVWAAHAVAHVMEMQGRPRDGIAWVDGLDREWSGCNNFVFHIRWHRALFHLDLEQYDRVLELYDREIRAESTEEYLDITNAVAMLWRLEQAGVDVGRRWAELAERSAPRIDDHILVFADLHYVLALAAAGDTDGVERWLRSSRGFADAGETQSSVMSEVGLALGEASIAHRRGEWDRVVALLAPVRPLIRMIGGSHAQRDLYHEMLIDAALRGGNLPLARALLSERTQLRPRNVWGLKHHARVAAAQGDGAAAAAAEREARRLLAAPAERYPASA
ncbi:MAG: tetratricopeptide repeat protein [Alphaproteobacteria bacterium]|nr:tetratricopeptide repeat protein [Alphaproteobacteria bacterium]